MNKLPLNPVLNLGSVLLRVSCVGWKADCPWPDCHNQEMEDVKTTPRIIEALRFRDGVVITFEDGKCAVYTAALLYAMFPNADELIQDRNVED